MANQSTTMSVSLPKELKSYIQHKAKKELFGTPSDYMRNLIRDDIKRSGQENLEKALLEGLVSGPAKKMTKSEWGKLRAEARAALREI